MTHLRRNATIPLAAVALLALTALLPARAEARGGHGFHYRPAVHVSAFYGLDPYFAFGYGYGFGPYLWPYSGFSPYYGFYPPARRLNLNAAAIAGVGAVEMDVKPNRAEVWVDGKYVAEARDLDGDPSFLWLPEGSHQIAVVKGGYETFEKQIDVRRGTQKELSIRLEKGESKAPTRAPSEVS